MATLVLKIKTKSGQLVLRDLTKNHTVSDLKNQLSQKCQIPQNALHVLSGFPPKPVNLSNNLSTLESVGIHTGDTLIVEEKIGTFQNKENEKPLVAAVESTCVPACSDEPQYSSRGILMKKVVPADNSCLFTSINFALTGAIDTSCGTFMRQLIADYVISDPENYSEAVLNKPPKEYCEWIRKPESWGGAIELSILSKFYNVEMAVVDTLNAIIQRFGEDKHYPTRIFLIFDGIHYDPLYLELFENGDIETKFSTDDEALLGEAETLAKEAKSSRQFTDVTKFHIKCLECQIILKGQVEAQNHAKSSGHVQFGEV